MLVKVMNIPSPINSSSKDINYGLVDSFANESMFNSFRAEKIYDYDAVTEMLIPFKTIIKYPLSSVFARELIKVEDGDDSIDGEQSTEINYDYVNVGGILEIVERDFGENNG